MVHSAVKKIKKVLKPGFTIIELLVVIVTIAILTTIIFAAFEGSIDTASEATLKSDLSSALQQMRLYYAENVKYPEAIDDCPTPAADNICLKKSGDNEYTYSPIPDVNPKTFSLAIDNGDVAYGITETSTAIEKLAELPVSYKLTVIAGAGGTVSAGGTYTSVTTKTITATPDSGYTFTSWTGSTGCSGVVSHTIIVDDDKTCTANFTADVIYTLTTSAGTGGTVSAGGSYIEGTVRTITATPATYYSFVSWTGSAGCSGTASHTITMDANKTCTANFTPTTIATPTAPTVTANTVGVTTTFSWGATSCPGNTARYQYRYTISPSGYDSGLLATAGISLDFTTSTQNLTYALSVQAQCYNPVISSSWSVAGTSSYYRPATLQVLVVAGGGGGSIGGGGAGGVVIGNLTLSVGSISVTVGGGGAGGTGIYGGGGGNSVFSSMTAYGGGPGGYWVTNGWQGGSGGGGGHGSTGIWTYGGAGTQGTGGTARYGNGGGDNGGGGNNDYYPSGGGGGAGSVGSGPGSSSIAGNGGLGITSSITGSSVSYAGGGGGGLAATGTSGGFGNAGGGNGANGCAIAPTIGTANTGGGGGGGSNCYGGTAGGSGVVIVSYPTGTLTATGGTITTSGGNTIHKFTSSGTFTVS